MGDLRRACRFVIINISDNPLPDPISGEAAGQC